MQLKDSRKFTLKKLKNKDEDTVSQQEHEKSFDSEASWSYSHNFESDKFTSDEEIIPKKVKLHNNS